MDLSRQPTITLTLHQLKRLVQGYYHLDDCQDLNAVAAIIFQQAELCAELGCEECAETSRVLAGYALSPAAVVGSGDKEHAAKGDRVPAEALAALDADLCTSLACKAIYRGRDRPEHKRGHCGEWLIP